MPNAPWLRALTIVAMLSSSILPAVALAQPAKPAAASPEDAATKKATAFFLKGAEFVKLGRHALALEQFKQSYATVPSPNSRFYMARCLSALGELKEAYREYDKVIAEVKARGPSDEKYAQTGETAKIERDELAPKVALVTITPPKVELDLSVRVGGEMIPKDQWKNAIAVTPGLVPVEIQIGNQVAASQSVTVAVGQKKEIVLESSPAVQAAVERASGGPKTKAKAPEGGSVLRPLAYAAGGVGVAGMVIFAVSGAMSGSTYAKLESQCGKAPCPAGLSDEISKGKTQQTVANVGLVLGVVGLAGGATMFVLSRGNGKQDAAPKKASAHVELGAGYVGVAGQF